MRWTAPPYGTHVGLIPTPEELSHLTLVRGYGWTVGRLELDGWKPAQTMRPQSRFLCETGEIALGDILCLQCGKGAFNTLARDMLGHVEDGASAKKANVAESVKWYKVVSNCQEKVRFGKANQIGLDAISPEIWRRSARVRRLPSPRQPGRCG